MMTPEIVAAHMDMPLDPGVLARAGRTLAGGGLVVYPASTLYGLGASIRSPEGMERLFAVKNRPEEMAVSVMASMEQIAEICMMPEPAADMLERLGPGITLLLPARQGAPAKIVKDGVAAVRLATGPLLMSLVDHVGPLTATSANIHGRPPPARLADAVSQLGDSVRLYIDAGGLGGRASTIVDLAGPEPKVIRWGEASPGEMADFLDGGALSAGDADNGTGRTREGER